MVQNSLRSRQITKADFFFLTFFFFTFFVFIFLSTSLNTLLPLHVLRIWKWPHTVPRGEASLARQHQVFKEVGTPNSRLSWLRINADYANLKKFRFDLLFASSPSFVSYLSDFPFSSFRSAFDLRKSAAESFIRQFEIYISSLDINSARLRTPNLMKIWRR